MDLIKNFKWAKLLVLPIILASCYASIDLTKTNARSEWTTLFSSKGIGWISQGEANWDLVKGQLIGTKGNGDGYVYTEKSFGDFHLKLEFYPDEKVNSGIFLRCDPNEIGAVTCYEANIWDNHVNQEFRTGSIVTHMAPLKTVQTINQWNTYEIIANKNSIQTWINGHKTADLTDDKSSSGVVALQFFGDGMIKFRNVKIKEL